MCLLIAISQPKMSLSLVALLRHLFDGVLYTQSRSTFVVFGFPCLALQATVLFVMRQCNKLHTQCWRKFGSETSKRHPAGLFDHLQSDDTIKLFGLEEGFASLYAWLRAGKELADLSKLRPLKPRKCNPPDHPDNAKKGDHKAPPNNDEGNPGSGEKPGDSGSQQHPDGNGPPPHGDGDSSDNHEKDKEGGQHLQDTQQQTDPEEDHLPWLISTSYFGFPDRVPRSDYLHWVDGDFLKQYKDQTQNTIWECLRSLPRPLATEFLYAGPNSLYSVASIDEATPPDELETRAINLIEAFHNSRPHLCLDLSYPKFRNKRFRLSLVIALLFEFAAGVYYQPSDPVLHVHWCNSQGIQTQFFEDAPPEGWSNVPVPFSTSERRFAVETAQLKVATDLCAWCFRASTTISLIVELLSGCGQRPVTQAELLETVP